MFERDLLVASVAFLMGVSMIYFAIVDSGWYFENFLIRRVEAKRGRYAARKLLGTCGCMIILLGTYTLFSGWIWQRSMAAPVPADSQVEVSR